MHLDLFLMKLATKVLPVPPQSSPLVTNTSAPWTASLLSDLYMLVMLMSVLLQFLSLPLLPVDLHLLEFLNLFLAMSVLLLILKLSTLPFLKLFLFLVALGTRGMRSWMGFVPVIPSILIL